MPHPPIDSQITFLYTHDLDAAAHFYGTLMGLPLWLDQGGCRIYQVSSTAYLGICQAGPSEAQTVDQARRQQGNVIFTFVTEDVDAWYDQLRAVGVTFEKAPAINEKYRIYNCFFRDPSGYLLEIQRFLPTGE